jgi:hypothetical protein
MSTAKFTINADPHDNLGFDATAAQVLTLQLEDPGSNPRKVVFSAVIGSKDAPALVFAPTDGQPTTPGGTVTVTMPATGAHSYLLRCQLNDGVDADAKNVEDWTKERIVAVRSAGGLRKMVPGERTQYDEANGWTGAQAEQVDSPGGNGSERQLQTFLDIPIASTVLDLDEITLPDDSAISVRMYLWAERNTGPSVGATSFQILETYWEKRAGVLTFRGVVPSSPYTGGAGNYSPLPQVSSNNIRITWTAGGTGEVDIDVECIVRAMPLDY